MNAEKMEVAEAFTPDVKKLVSQVSDKKTVTMLLVGWLCMTTHSSRENAVLGALLYYIGGGRTAKEDPEVRDQIRAAGLAAFKALELTSEDFDKLEDTISHASVVIFSDEQRSNTIGAIRSMRELVRAERLLA